MRLRGARERRWAAVAAGLVALAVSGCSAQSGAAAVVDGKAIPVSDVHDATAELRPLLDITPASIVATLVAEPTVVRVAAEHGIVVSSGQVEGALQAVAAQQGNEGTTEFSDASLTVARASLLQSGMRSLPDAQQVQADLFAELDRLDVDMNPRYGSLDFSEGGITPVQHPWLVPQPEPEPAAP